MACFSVAIGLIGGEKKPPKNPRTKNQNNSGGSRVKFLFQQFAHSKSFYLKAFSSPVHFLHNSKSQVQCAFVQACHYPCKLYWVNMELGWVQLSNTWRHHTWGINEFWKSCQEFHRIYMQQQTRILSSLWAFITPPSVCLETQIRRQQNMKK